MTYCANCEASLTAADYEAGYCTNCFRKVRYAMFKRQSIKVATIQNGERVLNESVDALVLRSLAVHKPLQGGGFCVTHTPSGYKMAEAWKQKSCKELVRELDALDVDWDFTAEKPSESWFKYAQPILREFNSRVDR